MSSIESTVRQIVSSLCGVPPDSIQAGADLETALGVDSMKILVLRESLERSLGIVVLDEDVRHLTSVSSIIGIAEKRKARGGPVASGDTFTGSGSRIVTRGVRLSPSGVLYTDIDVGMPLTGRNGLSEGALLRELGHLRWQHLSAITGVPSREIADEAGTRLYPTFFFVETAFPKARPMGTYGENDRFTVAATLGSFGRALLDGTNYLFPSDASDTPTPPLNEEQATANGIPWVRLSNSFVAQWQGAAWLKRSRPANPGFERLRELAEPPDSYELRTQAKEQLELLSAEETYVPLTTKVTVPYQLIPDRDLNGAGLVYFANFPMFLDIAERSVLGSLETNALSQEILDRRTLVHRKSVYLSNASSGDLLDISVNALVDNPFRGTPRDPELTPLRLLLHFTVTRRSDSRLMMVSSARKVVLGQTLVETGLIPFLEQSRG